jgi:hypothetical protein
MRKALKKIECGFWLRSQRVLEGGVSYHEALRWLACDCGRRIRLAGEERNLAERHSRFAGVNHGLPAVPSANDANLALENKHDTLRRVARRPENLPRRKVFLDGALEERITGTITQFGQHRRRGSRARGCECSGHSLGYINDHEYLLSVLASHASPPQPDGLGLGERARVTADS